MANNTPAIRFEGFSGDWEERQFEDHIKKIQTGTNLLGKINNRGMPLIKMGNLQRGYFSLNKLEKLESIPEPENILNYGDFIFNTRNTLDLVGKGATWMGGNSKYAFNSNIARFTFKGINTIFYNYLYNTSSVISQVRARAVGTTSVSAVYPRDLNSVKYYLPSIEEQSKIGDFFKQLDDTIVLQQQELDTLKQTKQGFLQKMFPKEGETVPEVRFEGFNGEWEESIFFENIQSTIDFRGRTPKKIGLDWSEDGYLALSALNVKKGFIDFNSDAHYGSQELYDKWMGDKKLTKGQVLFTTEAPMGNVAQVPDDKGYILSQRTVAFEVNKEKMTNDFLATLLRSPNIFNKLTSLSSGGTAKGVSQRSLAKLKVTVPIELEEQQKIGDFFKQLDDTIALHQRELDALKETKQAFLQKMFV